MTFKYTILAGAIFFYTALPFGVFALDYDATVSSKGITFASQELYAGEKVRVYGTIVNKGADDIAGRARFFQGPIALGNELPFSLKASGATEEIWIDWRPPEGTFNLTLQILSTDPDDQDLNNNTAVTPLMAIAKRPPPPPPAPFIPIQALPVGPQATSSQGASSQAKGDAAKKEPPDAKSTLDQKKKNQGAGVDTKQSEKRSKASSPAAVTDVRGDSSKQQKLGTSVQADSSEEYEIPLSVDDSQKNTLAVQSPAIGADTLVQPSETSAQGTSAPRIIFLVSILALVTLVAGILFLRLAKKEK